MKETKWKYKNNVTQNSKFKKSYESFRTFCVLVILEDHLTVNSYYSWLNTNISLVL